MDVFTCGTEGDPNAILKWIEAKFPPQHKKMGQNQRGIRKHMQDATEKVDKPSDIIPNKQIKNQKIVDLKSKTKF